MKQKVALFDFDDTIIHGDSIHYLLRYYVRQHPLSVFRFCIVGWYYILYKIGLSDFNKAKSELLFPLNTMDNEEIKQFYQDYVCNKYYQNVVDELKEKKSQGYQVYIVSASVERYLMYCDLPVDIIIGTKTEIVNGKCIMVGKNCRGKAKVKRIQEVLNQREIEIDYDNSFAYSDSTVDKPMLMMVKNRVRINKKNGEMSPFLF